MVRPTCFVQEMVSCDIITTNENKRFCDFMPTPEENCWHVPLLHIVDDWGSQHSRTPVVDVASEDCWHKPKT